MLEPLKLFRNFSTQFIHVITNLVLGISIKHIYKTLFRQAVKQALTCCGKSCHQQYTFLYAKKKNWRPYFEKPPRNLINYPLTSIHSFISHSKFRIIKIHFVVLFFSNILVYSNKLSGDFINIIVIFVCLWQIGKFHIYDWLR